MSIRDLIIHALDKNPVEFGKTFEELISQRAVAAIDEKRTAIAQSLYAEETVDEDINEDEIDELDIDEDIDLDDLDLTDIEEEIGNDDEDA